MSRRNNIAYEPEDCGFCNGSGIYLLEYCPVCSGQGSVLVAQPSQCCARCRGTGRIHAIVNIFAFLSEQHIDPRCPVCGGSGYAHSIIDD